MTKVNHIVLFKFKDDVSATQIIESFQILSELQDIIPGLESFTWGPYSSPEGMNQGYTHGFTMVFTDEDSRNAYLPHPEHERVKGLIVPIVDSLIAFDYKLTN